MPGEIVEPVSPVATFQTFTFSSASRRHSSAAARAEPNQYTRLRVAHVCAPHDSSFRIPELVTVPIGRQLAQHVDPVGAERDTVDVARQTRAGGRRGEPVAVVSQNPASEDAKEEPRR